MLTTLLYSHLCRIFLQLLVFKGTKLSLRDVTLRDSSFVHAPGPGRSVGMFHTVPEVVAAAASRDLYLHPPE